ncbi:putative extracellular protein, partial [Geopyxis carbonaria]
MFHLAARGGIAVIRLWFLAAALFSLLTAAHMVMSEPPPINYKTNPHYTESKGDFDYTSPLSPSGANFPCKGHLKDLNTPEGGSVRDYSPGGEYDLKIDGSAVHGGGSCQASLSYDQGTTWTVIKSWIGNCPKASGGGQNFKFKIPSDAPGGECIFGWTWFNEIGNREMYMNCAVVTIKGGSTRVKRALAGPQMFVANVGNGCSVAEGTDVEFPDPGTEVTYDGDQGKRGPPSGTC